MESGIRHNPELGAHPPPPLTLRWPEEDSPTVYTPQEWPGEARRCWEPWLLTQLCSSERNPGSLGASQAVLLRGSVTLSLSPVLRGERVSRGVTGHAASGTRTFDVCAFVKEKRNTLEASFGEAHLPSAVEQPRALKTVPHTRGWTSAAVVTHARSARSFSGREPERQLLSLGRR